MNGQHTQAGGQLDEYRNDPEWRNFYWTSKDNPLSELQKNIQGMIETMPKRYVDREIFARFDVFFGQVYEEFDRSIHVLPRALCEQSIVQEITDLYARFAESGEELVSLIYNAARLDLIMTSIKTILHTLRMEEEQQLRITWAEEYKLSLFHHLYFLEQDAQVEVRLPQINTGMVLAALERPWKGRHFSKRIRMRTDLLAAAMEDVITQGATQGWGVTRTAKEITKRTSRELVKRPTPCSYMN